MDELNIPLDDPRLARLVKAAAAVLNFKGDLENNLTPLSELEEAVAPFVIRDALTGRRPVDP